MKEQAVIEAITKADAAGVASGFEQGVRQVADNLVNQGSQWRAEAAELRKTLRWWRWGVAQKIRDLEAVIGVVEAIAKQLRKSVEEQHAPMAEQRRTVAKGAALLALAKPPTIAHRLRTVLGGVTQRKPAP